MRAKPSSILIGAAVQASFVAFATLALAQPSGEELHEQCQKAATLESGGSVGALDALHAGQCMAFVTGLTSGLHVANLLENTGRSYCPPETLSPSQAVSIIRAYISRYPELMHEDAGLLAADALITEFPCAISSTPTSQSQNQTGALSAAQ